MIDDAGEWWLSEVMKVIRQLLIAWMLVVFLMLQGFGQDDNDFSWDDFTYNSPEEKAFWDNVPVWSDVDVALFIDDIRDPFWVFDSDGSLADENSTDLFTGYAKSMLRNDIYAEDRYGNSMANQHERIIGYFKDGILYKLSYFNEIGKGFLDTFSLVMDYWKTKNGIIMDILRVN